MLTYACLSPHAIMVYYTRQDKNLTYLLPRLLQGIMENPQPFHCQTLTLLSPGMA